MPYNSDRGSIPGGLAVKTILNKTRKPIKIPLAGGKVLYLGPSKTGQISNGASGTPAVRRLVETGEIEILGEAAHPVGGGETGVAHEATQGHPPETMGHRRGNR